MRKITTKIAALFMFTMAALQVNAQAFNSEDGEGMYRIQLQGTDVCMSLPDALPIAEGEFQTIVYQTVDATKNEQVFRVIQVFDEEGNPVTGRYHIESVVTGKGSVEILDITRENPPIGCRNSFPGDPADGIDIWNPTRGTGTQLFSENTSEDAEFASRSKRRLQNAELGLDAQLSGGSPTVLDWVRVETLSTPEALAGASLKAFPNPSASGIFNLSVETAYTVYSVLGKQVLQGSGSSVNLSQLSKGLYILKTDAGQTIRLIF